MSQFEWIKQGASEKSIFSGIEWSRPERRDQAGQILIMGGNLHALGAPMICYQTVKQTSPGQAIIVLPNATKRLVGDSGVNTVFLPSTPSGEFAQNGLNELIPSLSSVDALVVPGDVGRNSQTSLLLESILSTYNQQVVLSKDAVTALTSSSKLVLDRDYTTIVASLGQLQRLIKHLEATDNINSSSGLVKNAEILAELSQSVAANIVTLIDHRIIVASQGKVCTTKLDANGPEPELWQVRFSGLAACYLTWNPKKQFEALGYVSHLLAIDK